MSTLEQVADTTARLVELRSIMLHEHLLPLQCLSRQQYCQWAVFAVNPAASKPWRALPAWPRCMAWQRRTAEIFPGSTGGAPGRARRCAARGLRLQLAQCATSEG